MLGERIYGVEIDAIPDISAEAWKKRYSVFIDGRYSLRDDISDHRMSFQAFTEYVVYAARVVW